MSKGNQRIKNDLKGEPDFDLDEYIEKNGREDSGLYQEPLDINLFFGVDRLYELQFQPAK